MSKYHLAEVDDYRDLVGEKTIERVKEKAASLNGMHIAHVNSTYYGGGVAEILSSLTLLMNSLGIKTGWRIIQGSPDFFSITKKMHNALQGGKINLTPRKKKIYEQVIFENTVRNHLDHDLVIIHDPQPLWMIHHYDKKGPWVWHCHLDMSDPDNKIWDYLSPVVEKYDGVIMSLEEYRKDLETPQVFFMPAIDPFSIKNKPLSEKEVQERLDHYQIPTDLPLVAQISRFDKWKDPEGAINAFKKAREKVDARLVLLGNVATDDPEGEEVYKSLLDERDETVHILSAEDTALVNALQRKACVVMQKSIREGFGLTVAEAMWKGTPVIGGDVGGIRHQIKDGENGYLVSSPEEAADRIVTLIGDRNLCGEMGKKAKETVRESFLMVRLLEQYLDFISSFRTAYKYKG
ncbi:MAG: glycosyltransferase [Candidatus Omnitrophica bacterium]|nr:glycosyltransferase [Candidatus Omnitrophota bacterium]